MYRIIARLLPLFLLCLFHPNNAGAQQGGQPLNLKLGNAVVTGFSGTVPSEPAQPGARNRAPSDFTFINPDGPSVRVINVSRPGYIWDGRLFAAPKTFAVFAKDVGQVFGVALDDSAPPNIYVAATSVFGLNIVVRGRDGMPERRKKGAPGAGWMKGQFGLDLQGGPGSIYKIDGRTGVPMLFANVTLNGVPNPGPGLGNLAYDSAHKQLFVSDFHTGMIHRFALDGKELGVFDHGVSGLGAAKLAAVPFNPANRPNIASDRFDSEKPDSWGFTHVARQVWGLAVHEGRLYYSVVAGPQIWSVGIERDGSFAADPRWELDVPAQAGHLPISDIAFSQKGAMILAQRAPIAAAYNFVAFTQPGEPQVLRVWLKGPNDPPSPGRWKLTPEEYAVGFAGKYRNTNGGVALGYGYGQDGMLQPGSCEAALWTTGQNLRNNPALKSQLEPGGPLLVHGLQGSPIDMVRGANEPPWTSYAVDYDDRFDDPSASGHLGSVRVFAQPCAGAVAVSSPSVVASPAGGGGGGGNVCYPANQPTSLLLPPLSLPPCTQPGQPVSLDLSTVLSYPGVDPNWAVTPFGPQGHSTAIYFGWTTLPNRWIQPKQFYPVVNHPVQTYVYTRKFNLPSRPECYKKLQLCGQYGSDNSSVVTLNAPANVLATSSNSYSSPAVPFCTTGTSFFVQGLNVLTVTVKNNPPVSDMNPTGMAMIAKLEAICGPDCVCGCPEGTVLVDGTCVPTNPIDLKVDKEDTPSYGGGRVFNVWVTNVGPPITFPAGAITVDEVVPAGMTVTGVTGTGWTCVPPTIVGPGTMHCTYNLAGTLGTGVALSSTLVVHYTTSGPGPFRNCAIVGIGSSVGTDTNPSNDKACADVTGTPAKPVDVGIVKTGGTTPWCPAPYYVFYIKVTNGPTPWAGTGNIVVTDTVPANISFGPISAPGWSCNGLSPPPGTTFTCTYTGPALTANQVLPLITIPATPTVGPPFPPYTNTASVSIPSGSGYVDTVPTNNSSTVTVAKPAGCGIQPIVSTCEAPLVPGAIPGQCICGPGTQLVGTECVKKTTCEAPKVLGPNGQCICGPGYTLRGKECVKQPACEAPKVPGPAGQCICGPGYMPRGKGCVKETACISPAKSNGHGGCDCPEGWSKQGSNKCVKRERKGVTGDDVRRSIDIIRGIPGSNPRGGRDNPRPGTR